MTAWVGFDGRHEGAAVRQRFHRKVETTAAAAVHGRRRPDARAHQHGRRGADVVTARRIGRSVRARAAAGNKLQLAIYFGDYYE